MIVVDNYEIVYSSDDNFAPILGTSLVSLFENNKNINFNISIFDSEISKDNKKRIEKIFNNYNRKLPRWIKPTDLEKKLCLKLNTSRGSLAEYSRLFLGKFFNSQVKRLLYIDSDTIIASSIEPLLKQNLDGKIIGATKDAFSKYYRQNININSNDAMINSGVFLVDLEKWREFKVEKKCLNYIREKKGKIQLGDQGVLNHVLNHKIYFLNPKYNLLSIYYEYSYKDMIKYRKPVNFYSEEQINSAKKSPVIIHYTSAFNTVRPWYKETTHPKANLWLKCYKMTPWGNITLKKENKRGIKKILFKVYKHIPQKIALNLASIFQIYVRPLYIKYKN